MPEEKITPAQKRYLLDLFKQIGVYRGDHVNMQIHRLYGVPIAPTVEESVDVLTKREASRAIERLKERLE